MTVFLNGRFIPEAEARISVLDRGFTYGDGLFETMRVVKGTPFRWNAHIARLQRGLDFLQIRLPNPLADLEEAALTLIRENATTDAVLRLVVSRGVGTRGYSPRGAESPTVVMTLHAPSQPPPKPLRLLTSSYRLKAGDPLLQHKTCNKLLHVMARAEADQQGFDDALLLNDRGEAITATSANLFRIADETVYTAPVNAGALPGISRAIVQELCAQAGIECVEQPISHHELKTSDGLFVSSTTLEIAPVGVIDTQEFGTPKLIRRLSTGYAQINCRT